MREACSQGPFVYLTMIRDDLPKGTHIRLNGKRGGPLGKVCTVKASEQPWAFDVTAVYSSAEVLAWMDRAAAQKEG